MPNTPQGQSNPAVLLVDNGSLAPAATLGLRSLSTGLAQLIGQEVRPVSLLHSSAVDRALLDGQSAEILEPALRQLAQTGQRDIVIVPLFLGPSGALTDYLPQRVHHLREMWPDLRVRLAPCLVNTAEPDDQRVARLLVDQVKAVAATANFTRPAVAVVDHGSPQRAVQAVRELVAAQTRALLGPLARQTTACSMERRPGAEYDFNEPLLETLLNTPDFSSGEVIIARLFLLPGRHAGPGGDIEQIGRAATMRHPGLKIAYSEPLGMHPGLLPILAERLEQGRNCPVLV